MYGKVRSQMWLFLLKSSVVGFVVGLICFGSALKQLAGVDRFRHLAGDRRAKLHNLLFD